MNEKKVEELAAKYADSVHPIQKPDWDDVFHWDDLCEAFKSGYAAAQQSGDGWSDEEWINFIQWYAGMTRSSVLQGINQYKSQTPDQ